MKIGSMIMEFLKGITSAISSAGVLKGVVADAIADGVEAGVDRVMPMLLKNVVLAAILAVGVALFGFGLGRAADAFFVHPGIGFMLVGGLMLLGGGLYLVKK